MLFYYDKMLDSLKQYLGPEWVNCYDCEGIVETIQRDLKRFESLTQLESIESVEQLPLLYFDAVLDAKYDV